MLLDHKNEKSIGINIFEELMKVREGPNVSREKVQFFFKALDTTNNGRIDMLEWLDLCDILLVRISINTLSYIFFCAPHVPNQPAVEVPGAAPRDCAQEGGRSREEEKVRGIRQQTRPCERLWVPRSVGVWPAAPATCALPAPRHRAAGILRSGALGPRLPGAGHRLVPVPQGGLWLEQARLCRAQYGASREMYAYKTSPLFSHLRSVSWFYPELVPPAGFVGVVAIVLGSLRVVRAVYNDARIRERIAVILRVAPFMWYFSVAILMTYYAFAVLGMELLGGRLSDQYENFNSACCTRLLLCQQFLLRRSVRRLLGVAPDAVLDDDAR